jgi:hypothetical protein
MRARSRSENIPVSQADLRRRKRVELLSRHPELSDKGIEARLDRIMARGSKPTSSIPLPSLGIPVQVQKARDDARRAIVSRRKRRK